MIKKSIMILMADDDPDDRLLAKEAFEESKLLNEVRFVEDGEELMNYLLRKDKYSTAESSPKPGIILLDLNMPKKDGREALEEIKSNPNLCSIPVIILTTSKLDEDIVKSYQLGVNSFIKKPVDFTSLAKILSMINKYWFEIVELPSKLES